MGWVSFDRNGNRVDTFTHEEYSNGEFDGEFDGLGLLGLIFVFLLTWGAVFLLAKVAIYQISYSQDISVKLHQQIERGAVVFSPILGFLVFKRYQELLCNIVEVSIVLGVVVTVLYYVFAYVMGY